MVVAHRAQRAADLQLRMADGITAFAGSMPFVYIHAALFGIWMLFIESNPWPMLTLTVSLEAIFLSTFVMIDPEPAVSLPASAVILKSLNLHLERWRVGDASQKVRPAAERRPCVVQQRVGHVRHRRHDGTLRGPSATVEP